MKNIRVYLCFAAIWILVVCSMLGKGVYQSKFCKGFINFFYGLPGAVCTATGVASIAVMILHQDVFNGYLMDGAIALSIIWPAARMSVHNRYATGIRMCDWEADKKMAHSQTVIRQWCTVIFAVIAVVSGILVAMHLLLWGLTR